MYMYIYMRVATQSSTEFLISQYCQKNPACGQVPLPANLIRIHSIKHTRLSYMENYTFYT